MARLAGVTLTIVPSFRYKKDLHVEFEGKDVVYDTLFLVVLLC